MVREASVLLYWYILEQDGRLHPREEDTDGGIVGMDSGGEVANWSGFGGRNSWFSQRLCLAVRSWLRRRCCSARHGLRPGLLLWMRWVNKRLVEIMLPWCIGGFGRLNHVTRMMSAQVHPRQAPT